MDGEQLVGFRWATKEYCVAHKDPTNIEIPIKCYLLEEVPRSYAVHMSSLSVGCMFFSNKTGATQRVVNISLNWILM